MKRHLHIGCALAAALMLTACAVGPDFKKPDAPSVTRFTTDPLPSRTVSADGAAQSFATGNIPADWWKLFQSPLLLLPLLCQPSPK